MPESAPSALALREKGQGINSPDRQTLELAALSGEKRPFVPVDAEDCGRSSHGQEDIYREREPSALCLFHSKSLHWVLSGSNIPLPGGGAGA